MSALLMKVRHVPEWVKKYENVTEVRKIDVDTINGQRFI